MFVDCLFKGRLLFCYKTTKTDKNANFCKIETITKIKMCIQIFRISIFTFYSQNVLALVLFCLDWH